MANTPGFTVDLSQYEIPDKPGRVTQDKSGSVDYWFGYAFIRPRPRFDTWVSDGKASSMRVCTGPNNPNWKNANTEWPLHKNKFAINLSQYNIADALMDANHPYHNLAVTLADAFDQAASGKGHERHGKGVPFNEQRMQTIARGQGHIGGLIYQICKKAQECERMDAEARRRELHGVIVYAAGAIINDEQKEG